MIVRKRKARELPIFVFGLIVILAIAYSMRGQFTQDLFKAFPPSDFGYSTKAQLERNCSINCVNAISRGVIHKLVSPFSETKPDVIELHIGFEEWETLLADQRQAISRNKLIDPREVNATVHHGGMIYKVRARLKGELRDHWEEPGRMSLKIDVRGGKTILGFSTFSLHKPGSRQHPYDSAYEHFSRDLGGLAAVHKYVGLHVNGENWGVWNMEERISNELLEKQQHKPSLIFNVSLDQFWKYYRSTENAYQSSSYRLKDEHLFASVYGKKEVRQDPNKRLLYSMVLQELMREQGADIFDWPAMTDAVALAYLWGTNHVLHGVNTRYYLNPYTLRLEPITSDQSWPQLVEKHALIYPYPKPYRNFIESAEFRRLFPSKFDSILKNYGLLDRRIDHYQGLFPNDSISAKTSIVENGKRGLARGYEDILQTHQEFLSTDKFVYVDNDPDKSAISESIVRDIKQHVHVRHFTNGVIRARNLLDQPVQILEIRIDDELIWKDLPTLGPKEEVDIDTNFDGIRDDLVSVKTIFLGHEAETIAGISVVKLTKQDHPLLNHTEQVDLPGFFNKSDSGYVVNPGSWTVDRSIVLEGNLLITEGVTLNFAPNAFLVVHGSLDIAGTEKRPVNFRGAAGRWKGLYVYEASRTSTWRHAIFSDTSELTNGPLRLTGGITLYKSDLDASHIEVKNTQGEDGLNVVHSQVTLNSVYFLTSNLMQSILTTVLVL